MWKGKKNKCFFPIDYGLLLSVVLFFWKKQGFSSRHSRFSEGDREGSV